MNRPSQTAADVEAAARELEPLVAESREVQGKMLAFRKRYARHGTKTPLSPRSLHEIRIGTRRYLDLQERLAEVTVRAEPLVGRDPAPPGADTVALAGATTLYDNYLAMLPLLADRRFRRMVNHPDLGYGIGRNELWHMVERLNDSDNRKRLHRLVDRWVADSALGAFDEIILSSDAFRMTRDATLDLRLPTAVRVYRERILDRLSEFGDDALYAVSEGFGNAIGQVEFRKGKLWQREDVLGHLHRVLRPLDLLLEKTPFRLTDLLIPGHFGHVAIWMGKPKELKRLGVWKQEALEDERHQHSRSLIEEGRGVLEALRSGVELNSLRVFANVDDLAILRPTHLKRKDKVESLVRGFQQVGKEYDFNFDVETTGTIVCSELPYHVYPGVEWTTEEQLGRFTISPDHIALEALEGGAVFDLVAFYHDGRLIPPKHAKDRLRELVT